MNLTDENTTSSQERGAVEETTENDQPTEKASVTGRLTAYFGDLLISAGTHLKNRSYKEKLQCHRTQRQIDVIKII